MLPKNGAQKTNQISHSNWISFWGHSSQIKGYPFEVLVISKSGINGAILADQVKSMDWKARKAEFVEAADKNLVAAVTARLLPLIESS